MLYTHLNSYAFSCCIRIAFTLAKTYYLDMLLAQQGPSTSTLRKPTYVLAAFFRDIRATSNTFQPYMSLAPVDSSGIHMHATGSKQAPPCRAHVNKCNIKLGPVGHISVLGGWPQTINVE